MVRVVHEMVGLGLCPTCNQLVQNWVGGFPSRNWLMLWVCQFGLLASGCGFHVEPKITGICWNAARSCQIHPSSGKILSDLVRFSPNHVEKSSVRSDPVYIVLEINKFSSKCGPNFGKHGRSWWSSGWLGFMGFRGEDLKLIHQSWVFDVNIRVWPSKPSDRMVSGQVWAGGVG